MRTFIAVGMAALFALATMIAGVTAIYIIDNEPPIVFYGSFGSNANAEVQTVFKAGDTFYARRDFRQNRAIRGEVVAMVRNTVTGIDVLKFGTVMETYRVGDYKEKFPVVLPPTMQEGSYVYLVTINYLPGWPFRNQTVQLPPIYFQVAK